MWNRDEFKGKTRKFKEKNNRRSNDQQDDSDIEYDEELEQIDDEIQEKIGDDPWRRRDRDLEDAREQ